MNLVSIIVPIFNTDKFLPACIESVIGQDHTNWEMLLVNDGSTDNSQSICVRYQAKDSRIKLISQPNAGLSAARNTGIDNSSGDFIFFLDSDDELLPGAISHLVAVATKRSADIVLGAFTTNPTKKATKRNASPRDLNVERYCRDVLFQKQGTDNTAWGKLYKRDLFNGLRFYNGMYEDLEIFPKILFKSNVVTKTNQTVYYYRQHPSSFLNNWSEARRDIVRVTSGIMQHSATHNPKLLRAAQHRHFSACCNVIRALLAQNAQNANSTSEYYPEILRFRAQVLFNLRSRFKNRIAALVSFLGKKPFLIFLSKL